MSMKMRDSLSNTSTGGVECELKGKFGYWTLSEIQKPIVYTSKIS